MNETPFTVIVGGANIDICAAPAGTLQTQDSNPGTVISSPGGVARNIAENLARLGAQCRLIAAVGRDHHGNLLLEQGREAGIDMQYMLQLDNAPTSTYVSILDRSGDMFVAVNDMTIVNEIRPDRLRAHEPMLRQASLVIADTNLGEDTLEYISQCIVRQPFFVDAVSTAKAARIKPHLNSVHTLKASRAEAESLSGLKAQNNNQLPKLADWFHKRGVVRAFITLDKDGVFYSEEGTQGLQDTGKFAARVSNTNGAGDAFVAGLAYAWLQQWPLDKSVRFAICAATVALSHRSTINPAMSTATVEQAYTEHYADTV